MMETCRYRQLQGISGLWQRWPELWNIVRGEFAWIGNRPLTREQAGALENDWERLWLAVPPGLFSLADAEGCADPLSDEARAHASFYAVQKDRTVNWRILRRTFARAWKRDPGMMHFH
jgi:lipopolysaccharide/colanic/teichoic acid biosynthesis glycosyltransferase